MVYNISDRLLTPFLAKRVSTSLPNLIFSFTQGVNLFKNSWVDLKGVSPHFHLFKIRFKSLWTWRLLEASLWLVMIIMATVSEPMSHRDTFPLRSADVLR